MLASFPLLQMRSLAWLLYSVYYTDPSLHDYTVPYIHILAFA
jgi:hypothetical protein